MAPCSRAAAQASLSSLSTKETLASTETSEFGLILRGTRGGFCCCKSGRSRDCFQPPAQRATRISPPPSAPRTSPPILSGASAGRAAPRLLGFQGEATTNKRPLRPAFRRLSRSRPAANEKPERRGDPMGVREGGSGGGGRSLLGQSAQLRESCGALPGSFGRSGGLGAEDVGGQQHEALG